MSGEGNGAMKGIQFRAIDTIYSKIDNSNKSATISSSISIRMLELYQDQLIDLLDETHHHHEKQQESEDKEETNHKKKIDQIEKLNAKCCNCRVAVKGKNH